MPKISDPKPKRAPFARVNKNFANHAWLPSNFNSISYMLLWSLLEQAQRRKKRCLKFTSIYIMKQELDIGSRKSRDLNPILNALISLDQLEIDIPKWYEARNKRQIIYDPDDPEDVEDFADQHDISPREAKAEMCRRNKPSYKNFKSKVLKFKIDKHSEEITIFIDKEFYRVNNENKFSFPVYLHDMRAAKTLPTMRLLHIARANNHSSQLTWSIEKWGKLVGLSTEREGRFLRKFSDAKKKVQEIRDGSLEIYEWKRGRMNLVINPAGTGKRHYNDNFKDKRTNKPRLGFTKRQRESIFS